MRFKLESNFSDGIDTICKKCGELESSCKCANIEIKAISEHKIHSRIEKRNGKIISIFYDFYLDDKHKKDILSRLKKSLSCGGTFKDKELELQGNFVDKARETLKSLGFK